MQCVTKSADRKIKFEKDPKTGSVVKVIFVSHNQKCSNHPNVLKLEEEERCEELEGDCELLEDSGEQEEEQEEEMTYTEIREHFQRYLKRNNL